MPRVRLFRSGRSVGFLAFDDTDYRIRPASTLPAPAVEVIRQELEAGHLSGFLGGYVWQREAAASCPLSDAKPCPCEDEVCGLEAVRQTAASFS
jgi:hypothetical protein